MSRTSHRSIATVMAALLLAALVPALTSSSPAAAQEPSVRLIVLFKQGVADRVQEEVAGAEGDVVETLEFIRARVIQVPASVERLVRKRLAHRSDVLAVEADLPVQTAATPTDPTYAADATALLPLSAVRLPAAWDLSTGAPSTIIAMIDTGVGPLGSELAAERFVGGFNALTNRTGAAATADDHGHGTKASSVAAAAGSNGGGIAGGCWSCLVMPVKVLSSSGSGTTSQVAAGIDWAVSHGADVLSLSLSGGGTTTLKLAVDNALSRGVPVVAAAGNDSTYATTRAYPAAYPGVIGVGGVGPDFSSVASGSNRGDWVSIAAPYTNKAVDRAGQVGSFSGTSSATPIVSGTVGLLVSASPTRRSPAAIRDLLITTSTDIAMDLDDRSGLLDARAALEAVTGGSSTTTTTTRPATTTTTTAVPTTVTTTGPTTTSPTTSPPTTTPPPTPPSAVNSTFSAVSYSGRVSRNFAVKAGRIALTSCATCTVEIYSGTTRLASGRGTTSVASVAAGTYSFRVTGRVYSTITYTITHPA